MIKGPYGNSICNHSEGTILNGFAMFFCGLSGFRGSRALVWGFCLFFFFFLGGGGVRVRGLALVFVGRGGGGDECVAL